MQMYFRIYQTNGAIGKYDNKRMNSISIIISTDLPPLFLTLGVIGRVLRILFISFWNLFRNFYSQDLQGFVRSMSHYSNSNPNQTPNARIIYKVQRLLPGSPRTSFCLFVTNINEQTNASNQILVSNSHFLVVQFELISSIQSVSQVSPCVYLPACLPSIYQFPVVSVMCFICLFLDQTHEKQLF